MTSPFVAVPPSPPAGSPDLVENDGWFPDIDLQLLRSTFRIAPAITPERLREATVFALQSIRRQLTIWQAVQAALGHASLADVPAPQIGGESRLLGLYRRAVHAEVAADLADNLRDLGTTAAGHDRADELEASTDNLRRAVWWAISDLTGSPRMIVELI